MQWRIVSFDFVLWSLIGCCFYLGIYVFGGLAFKESVADIIYAIIMLLWHHYYLCYQIQNGQCFQV